MTIINKNKNDKNKNKNTTLTETEQIGTLINQVVVSIA